MPNLSVIICTHNPRGDYLQRVLDALKAQTLPKEQWELLLIDNASKEPLAGKWDLSWHPHSRIIREDELGLTPARVRGIRQSVSALIVFLDDDNIAAPDYLAVAQSLSARHSNLGCFGAGKLEPEFEEQPPAELMPHVGALALRTVNEAQWSNRPADGIIPWGAGLAVRREVGERYCRLMDSCSIRRSLDRRGSQLNSGGDDEFSWVACEGGYGKGIFPELQITHLIDKRRVQLDYLLRIAEGHGFSHAFLGYVHGKGLENPNDKPRFNTFFNACASASVSGFFYHGLRWWNYRRKPRLERAFVEAWGKGWKRARESVASIDVKSQ